MKESEKLAKYYRNWLWDEGLDVVSVGLRGRDVVIKIDVEDLERWLRRNDG